jgi:actin-related protein 8
VFRQTSQAKAKREKELLAEEKMKAASQEGAPEVPDVRQLSFGWGWGWWKVHPLSHTLIIHPGSRNLRIGRASDFYPKEIPNCIARPNIAIPNGVGMSRTGSGSGSGRSNGRANKRAKLDEDVDMNGDGEADGVSKEAEDLVSMEYRAGLTGSWMKRLDIYEITFVIDYEWID